MSDPSLFASPLARQAARNLHTVEWLSENDTWRSEQSRMASWFYRGIFWRTRRMMAMTPDEAAAWLPAVAVTVQRETGIFVLEELSHWPLPEPLPPEAIPWRDRLIQVWEQYPADTIWEKTIRLAALVRLDRRAERLPEWLTEARQAMDLESEDRNLPLAALAGWRPRPGDRPVSGDIWNAVSEWVQFWERLYWVYFWQPEGLIAAVALLHLEEAGWLPSGSFPEQLREEFYWGVRKRSIKTYRDEKILRILLASVASAPERLRQNITDWLELIRENVEWEKRAAVWDMLAAWQREGGIGRGQLQELSLLPDLARALWEEDGDVVRAMAGYIPEAAEVSAHPEAAREVIAHWEALSQSIYWEVRFAAWVARWNLRWVGVLTAEEQARFDADYVEAIRAENNPNILLALAQITPPGTFPLAIWTRRLSDQDDRYRLAAQLAIHGWLVEVASGSEALALEAETE